MRYGRRYYDKFCLVCVKARAGVMLFHGICLSCLAKRLVMLPVMLVDAAFAKKV